MMECWGRLLKQWQSALEDNTSCVVMGYFNLDYMKWDSPVGLNKRMVDLMKEKVLSMGVLQLVQEKTRCTSEGRGTLIDQVWVNRREKGTRVDLDKSAASDHKLIKYKFGTATLLW